MAITNQGKDGFVRVELDILRLDNPLFPARRVGGNDAGRAVGDDRHAVRIILVGNRCAIRLQLVEQAFLRFKVILHRPVMIEMIMRQISLKIAMSTSTPSVRCCSRPMLLISSAQAFIPSSAM